MSSLGLLLRLPRALAGLTARASWLLARHTLPGLPLRHLGAPKTTSARPLPVSVSWKMRSRTMPAPAGPSATPRARPSAGHDDHLAAGPAGRDRDGQRRPVGRGGEVAGRQASTPPRTRW